MSVFLTEILYKGTNLVRCNIAVLETLPTKEFFLDHFDEVRATKRELTEDIEGSLSK